jgi:hypothetical protein
MNFDQAQREQFARLADILIPRGENMPSASEADVQGQWLDAVLAARPDLAEGLNDLLDRASQQDPADFVANLLATDAAGFGVLAEIVPAAYFMNPQIQQAIGYTGQGPRAIDPRPDYMEHGLLESVIRRGPIYRPTPKNTP